MIIKDSTTPQMYRYTTLHYNIEILEFKNRSKFIQSLMVSVGISKLSYTILIFVDPGVKVNGAYYCDVLLSQQLLPAIRQVYLASSSFSKTVPQRTGRARLSTSLSARLLHSSRQIFDRPTTPI